MIRNFYIFGKINKIFQKLNEVMEFKLTIAN